MPLRSRLAYNTAGPSVLVSRHKSVTPSRSVVNLTKDSPSMTNITKSPSKSPAKKRSRVAVPAVPLGLMSTGVFANPPQHVVSVHASPQHTSATTRCWCARVAASPLPKCRGSEEASMPAVCCGECMGRDGLCRIFGGIGSHCLEHRWKHVTFPTA